MTAHTRTEIKRAGTDVTAARDLVDVLVAVGETAPDVTVGTLLEGIVAIREHMQAAEARLSMLMEGPAEAFEAYMEARLTPADAQDPMEDFDLVNDHGGEHDFLPQEQQ